MTRSARGTIAPTTRPPVARRYAVGLPSSLDQVPPLTRAILHNNKKNKKGKENFSPTGTAQLGRDDPPRFVRLRTRYSYPPSPPPRAAVFRPGAKRKTGAVEPSFASSTTGDMRICRRLQSAPHDIRRSADPQGAYTGLFGERDLFGGDALVLIRPLFPLPPLVALYLPDSTLRPPNPAYGQGDAHPRTRQPGGRRARPT